MNSQPSRSGNLGATNESDGRTATVEVHHVTRDAPKGVAFFEHPESWAERREHYRHVATVEVLFGDETSIEQILEQVWTRLQHGVDGATSARVESHVTNRRSTSVGDVMVASVGSGEQSEKDPSPYEVGKIGFREIGDYNPDSSAGGGDPLPIGDLNGEQK